MRQVLGTSVMALVCMAGTTRAASPRLDHMQPQGGQRGTEVAVSFLGGRIGQDAEQLLFNVPGIEVRSLEKVDDNHLKATLAIAADSPLGIHQVRVRTTTGITNLRTFHVGALPESTELEPNSEFPTPQAIALGTVVNGVVTNEDVDYFVVEAAEGDRISVEVEGLRLGRTFFDPAVAILDEQRFELAASDDSTLLFQDCFCTVRAPKPGKYIIELRETSYRGDDTSTYRLHVGKFPRPAAAFPGGGPPGQSLDVRWLGDPLGERSESVVLPTQRVLEHPLHATDDGGISPSGIPLRVLELPNVVEAEPNEDLTQATPGPAPSAFCGILSGADDKDFFRFPAKKGEVFDIQAIARTIRSPLDPIMRISKASGEQLMGADDNGNVPDSYFRFTAPDDGEYVIEVGDHLRQGSPLHVYRVEITRPEPTVDLILQERLQYVATEVAIPQGNRMAVMVTANRREFGGELQLELGDLPAGVTAQAFPLAADFNRVPVVLTADPAAVRDAKLSAITAKLVDGSLPVRSNFRQQTWLVRGANNINVWSQWAERAAVAVVNPAPFSIRIVEPKVPLVQNGSMELKVVAERKDGFNGPIAVRTLYDPPGISSNRSISIAADATEVTIPITASAGTAAREWKMVVEAESDVNGPLLIASEFANLRVAAPYLTMTYPAAATEPGKPIDYPIAIENVTPFEGEATVTLIGLPPGVTTTPLTITKDSKQLVFPLAVAGDAKIGHHKQLFCSVVITEQGEPVTHTLVGGELRIDEPLPPEQPEKTAQQAPAVTGESS